jgi:DeoR family transcriptional regulator of aga operon
VLNEERRHKIQELLAQRRRILVKQISRSFNISEVTIRKDLKVLEKRGVLTRVHGGAILNQSSVTDLAITEKERINPALKERIARKAETMIHTGDVIILDSGSTTTFIARRIKFKKGFTVITNAINIAHELVASEIELILIGGILREKSFSLVGPLADEALHNITADKLFLGVDGIHFKYGLTTPNILEARVNQLMVKAAEETILVADSTKFGRRSLGVISEIKDVNTVITDSNINEDDLSKLKQLGIKVFLV